MSGAPRFERGQGGAGGLIDHRMGSPAEFLAKLWTLLGPPDGIADGRPYYFVHDRVLGIDFDVSVDAAGMSYEGAIDDAVAAPALLAFDEVLAQTPLADCELDIGVGGATTILGAKNGVAFEKHVPAPARTPDDEIARAQKTLATDYSDPMVYYLAMLELHERVPDATPVLAKLWQRAFAAAIATLDDEERSTPTTRQLALSALRQLEQSADLAGVDAAAREAVRDALKDRGSSGGTPP